jgi:hypothetical protein
MRHILGSFLRDDSVPSRFHANASFGTPLTTFIAFEDEPSRKNLGETVSDLGGY